MQASLEADVRTLDSDVAAPLAPLAPTFPIDGSYEAPADPHAGASGLKSVSSAVFLLSSLSLGVGVFSLPMVFNSVGWVWGLALCTYFGGLTTSLMIFVLEISTYNNCKTWEHVARLAPMARPLSRISLALSLIIGNAAHLQTVAGMLFDIMSWFVTDDYGDHAFTVQRKLVLLVIFLGIAAPLCTADDLGFLRHIGKSVAGVVLALCAAIAVSSAVRVARGEGAQGDHASPAVVPDAKALLISAPNVCFAFTSMLSFWEVFAALRRGVASEQEAVKRMRRAVSVSSLLVFSVYIVVAASGILAFGKAAGLSRKGNGSGNLLYNFSMDNYVMTALCTALIVVIVLDYPILNFPFVSMVLRVKRLGLGGFRYARHCVSFAAMLVVVLVDVAVPDLPDVFGLCGSLGLSVYCFVVPGLVCAFAGRDILSKSVGALAVITGLTMLFGGTFFIVKKIVTGHD